MSSGGEQNDTHNSQLDEQNMSVTIVKKKRYTASLIDDEGNIAVPNLSNIHMLIIRRSRVHLTSHFHESTN